MNIKVVQPPASMPVSLSQAKQHLRLETSTEDDLLTGIIREATDYCEVILRQNLIERTLQQSFTRDQIASGLFLTGAPVREVVEVRGLSLSGQSTIISPSQYTIALHDGQAHLHLHDDIDPATIAQGVTVDYASGLGQTGSEIPGNITRAILMLVAHWYEFRGATHRDEPADKLPAGLEVLLAPHRRIAL